MALSFDNSTHGGATLSRSFLYGVMALNLIDFHVILYVDIEDGEVRDKGREVEGHAELNRSESNGELKAVSSATLHHSPTERDTE